MKSRLFLCLMAATLPVLSGCAWWHSEPTPAEKITLGPLFRDGMVIQHNVKVPIWGWCEPGRVVKVEILAQKTTAVADPSGRWEATLEPLKSGGPLIINVIGSAKEPIYIRDVLVGDVWFWTGDSAAISPLNKAENSEREIKQASYNRLRLYANGKWSPAYSDSVKEFSAAGYFFGRRILGEVRVPVGIVQLAGGEAPVTAWSAPFGSGWKIGDASVLPFPAAGMVWYGGRPDTAEDYRSRLTAVYNSWRTTFGPSLPILTVQLPNQGAQWPLPQESRTAELRETQMQVFAAPNTYVISTIDLGRGEALPPQISQAELATRLGRVADQTVYKEHFGKTELPCCLNPVYERMSVERDRIRIHFKNTGKGLMVKDSQRLLHFAVAGKGGRYYWANAMVDGGDVVVWSGKVPHPLAVRYAWADNPLGCNLFNKDGLPAMPFRTEQPPVKVLPPPPAPVVKPVVPWWDVRGWF